MKHSTKNSFLSLLLLSASLILIPLSAQIPCDPTECCEENEGFEDFPLGSFPSSPPFQTAGFYTYSGNIDVVSMGRLDVQSVEYLTGTGSALAYTGGSGVAGPIPAMEAGNSYCIELCLFVGNDAGPVSLSISTSSNVIYSASYNFTGAWETITVPTYTPTVDHSEIFFNINGTPNVPIRLDNICIEAVSSVDCMADFDLESISECGEYCFINNSCGEGLTYDWSVRNASNVEVESSTLENPCFQFSQSGTYTVILTVSNINGCEDQILKEYEIEISTLDYSCDYGETIVASGGPGCTYDYTIPYLTWSGGSGISSIQVLIGGSVYNEGDVVQLNEGVNSIVYLFTDNCEMEYDCSYIVVVECEVLNKYDCPIDVLFIMDNSGSIDNLEYGQMATSALNEITAISSVYANANFAITHYSGTCGDNIMIEHDFTTAASIPVINRQFAGPMDDLDRSLDAVIDALSGTPNANILSTQTTLNRTPGSKFYIVIFTDAGVGASQPTCTNSALTPYTSINTLKGPGFDANVTLVHFIPIIPNVAAVGGAIASPGGNSLVTPDLNPGDPQGSSIPRQYIPANFAGTNINLLNTIPPCVPCTDCDDLSIVANETNQDSCCYSIDITNQIGNNIVKLEAEILTPGWIFNTSTLSTGGGFTWYPGSVPSANKICITDAITGSIPTGTTTGGLDYCFAPAIPGATGPQTVVYRWYSQMTDPNGELFLELECTDTITTECVPVLDEPCVTFNELDTDCNPDNSYEYTINFTVTNNSSTNATNVSLNGASGGYLFAMCGSSSGVSSISLPIPGGPLAPATTSPTMCVKILSPTPILSPEAVCFRLGLYSFMGECCHTPEVVCVELDPCCDPCDITTIANDIMEEGQCCYSLEIDNNCDYRLLTKMKATMLTTGVNFGYHGLGSGASPDWQMCGSSSQMLCIQYIGGTIPKGVHSGLLDFCLDDIDDPSEFPQQILIEYFGINNMNEDTLYCTDTITLECEPIVDNLCLETSDQILKCLPDSNKYQYTFTVTNTSTIPFTATDLDLFVISPSGITIPPSGGTFPLSPSLSTGGSQTITTCIQGSSFPITDPDIVFGYRLRYLSGDTCCYENVLDTIPVPPCNDCCDEDRLDQELDDYLNTLSVSECKLSLGPIELDTCVGMNIKWGDGTGDFYHIDSLTCKTYDQGGIYNVYVTWEVYPDLGIFPCYTKDTCFNVEVIDCPSTCFTVVDIDIKDVTCDSIDCYETPFCVPWLVDDISAVSCTGFNDPYYEKATYNGQSVFIKQQPTIEGLGHTIYDCSGNILQSCFHTGGGGLSCVPDAGIDTNTDLSNVANIWSCGDAVPTVDPACPTGKSVDYCVTLMNTSAYDAANVMLNQITPAGITITPSNIGTLIPSGGTSTISFTVTGPASSGADFKLDATLSGLLTNGDEWSCNDTLCLPAPPCPTECCQDEDAFISLVNQGLEIHDLGDCTYQVCANQFNDCHWFWTASPDWGDGTIVLPTLTQSDSPNNCWTHTYTTQGPHTITLNVEEQNENNEACWNGQMQAIVDCDIMTSCCDGMTDDDFCDIHDQLMTYTSGSCNQICWQAPQHPCDFVQVDNGDGSTSGTFASGDTYCYTYSTDGIYTACAKLFRIDDITGDTCFVKEDCVDINIDCDTPTCADCPDGSTSGPNLIINGDFESGNIAFSSGLSFVSSANAMSSGDYGVRNFATMGNWFWDNASNTSQFLQIDGLPGTSVWSQNINIISGETYIFCAEFDNLVDPNKLLEAAAPTVSIRINGSTIGGLSNVPIDQLPDALQVISTSWLSNHTGTYSLEIFMNTTGTYGDIAIDNISFAQCGGCDIVGDPCDLTDLTVADIPNTCCFEVNYDNQYCSNYFKGFMVTTVAPNTVSQITANTGWYINQISPYIAEIYPIGSFPLGSGSAFEICGDNPSSSSLDFSVSWLVPSPSGCDAICEDNFSRTCDAIPSSCISIIDDTIDCDQYCFRVTNNTYPGFTINSIVLDQITPSSTIITPNPISIPALSPGATSSLICVDYTNLLPSDTFCYTVIAHDVDITQGDLPTWCCTDTITKCAIVPDDCNPCNDLDIVTSSTMQGDTCCWSVDIVNNYHNASFVGIKAKVLTSGTYFANINTTLDWTLDYQSADEYIFDYDAGSGFIPLGTNVTGDFCLTGYTTGLQQVEFSWLQIDPMTGDTIEVCPVVIDSNCDPLPPPIPCTDISDVMIDCVDDAGNYTLTFNLSNNTHLYGAGYNALSYSLSNLSTTGSTFISPIHNNLTPPLMPNMSTMEMLNISGATPGDSICFSITLHDQVTGGSFNNCCTADSIWCYVIPSDSPCNQVDDCCDTYDIDSLTQDVNIAVNSYRQDGCEICFDGEFPDCVNWYVDWGDGSSSIGTSIGIDTRCLEYEFAGTYTACMYTWITDINGDTCVSYNQCIDVMPDCESMCCDISDNDYDELFDDLVDYEIEDTCNFICFYLDGEACDLVTIDFGDGTNVGPVSGNSDEQCHEYIDDGIYNVCVTMYRPDDFDNSINCMERDTCFDIEILCDTIPPPVPLCDPNTWIIPNGLTPNGDGFNEELILSNTEDCTIDLKVYNRWGQLVFNKKDYQTEWHGQSNNGELLPDGTYYMLIGTATQRDNSFDSYITKYIDLRRE